MRSTLHIDTDRGLDPPERAIQGINQDTLNRNIPRGRLGLGDIDFFDDRAQSEAVSEEIQRSLNRAMPDDAFLPRGADFFPDESPAEWPGGRMRGVPGDFDTDFEFGGPVLSRDTGLLSGLMKGEPADFANDFGNVLKKFRPTIRTWTNLLAALIPALIAMAGAAVGLAASLGAVATAGAAIVGLGLLGWGDSFSESMRNAQRELKALGSELFGVLLPASNQFQPILEDWIQATPGEVQELVDPLQDLTAFADTLGQIGGGFINWVGNVLDAMVSLEGMVSQVVLRFGRLIGGEIIAFLSSMVREVYRNQEAYLRLIAAFGSVVELIFNLAKTVTFALSVFAPFISLAADLAGLLGNQVVSGLIAAVAGLWALNKVAGIAMLAMGALNGSILATAITMFSSMFPALANMISLLYSYIGAVTNARIATAALIGTASLGLGLLSFGLGEVLTSGPQQGAPGTGGRGGRGSGGDTYIQIQGDARKRDIDRVLDRVGNETRTEMNFQEEMG